MSNIYQFYNIEIYFVFYINNHLFQQIYISTIIYTFTIKQVYNSSKLEIVNNNEQQTSMKQYKILQQLGVGSFGKVCLAIHEISQQKIAIKSISKQRLKTKDDIKMINKQIAVFKSVQHENIVQLYQICQDSDNLYLVMQYMEKGDLLTFIKNQGNISQQKAVNFIQQLTSAVKYLHLQKNIAHRDIKLANILLNSNGKVKLADFGLSNFYNQNTKILKTSCGSPCYSAPQILKASKYNPLPADIWSLGVVLYALTQGNLPFYHENIKQMYKLVLKGHYTSMKKASSEIQQIISQIFLINPEERISIMELNKKLNNYLDKRKQIKYLTKYIIIPSLSNQSNQYVQNMKYQIIKKILKLNNFNQQEIQNNISYKKTHNKSLKYNYLNTFIQLLQKKTFNNLKLILHKYYHNYYENEQKKVIQNKSLQRIQSNYTMDSLKNTQKISRKRIKNKFNRNRVNKRIQIINQKSTQIIHNKYYHIDHCNNLLFQQKIIKNFNPLFYHQFLHSFQKNITSNKFIKNNYIQNINNNNIANSKQNSSHLSGQSKTYLPLYYSNHNTADKITKNSVSKINLPRIQRSITLAPFLSDRAHQQQNNKQSLTNTIEFFH